MSLKPGKEVLTIVVPVYNEAENLPVFAPALLEFCRARNWELIFVNDGSRDHTKQILDDLDSSYVHVIHHKVNRGYGGALKTGISKTTTPFLITMDGDGQHDPQDAERLLQFAFEKDADMVVGRRDARYASSMYRSVGKLLIRSFTKILMPLPVTDLNSGF